MVKNAVYTIVTEIIMMNTTHKPYGNPKTTFFYSTTTFISSKVCAITGLLKKLRNWRLPNPEKFELPIGQI